MRQLLFALTCLSVIAVPGAAQRPALTAWTRGFLAVDTPLVALTHVTVIDGTGAPSRADQTILLRDGRIQSVGASSAVAIPAAARVIDLRAIP